MSSFKKTPVGLLPVEWHIGAIEDFGEVITGSTPSTKDPGNFGNDYMFVTPSDINGCKYIRQSSRAISKQGFNTCRKIPPKSVVFVCIGSTIGKVAISTQACATNQQINAVVPRNENDAGYIFYYLQHRALSIAQLAGKQAVPIINKAHFSSLPIPIPDPEEQRAISAVLDKWDSAIEKIELLIAEKLLCRKGLMQQLLTGKRRLPGFCGEWQEVRLSSIFKRVQRLIPEGEIPEALSITAKIGFVSQRVKFSKVIAGKNLEKYILIRRGEFSYNKGNSLTYAQGCVFRLKEFDEGAVPNVFFSFRAASPEVHPDFYSHFFASGGLNHQLSRVINTGVRNDGLLNLNASDFFAIKVPFPPFEEQKQIAKFLTFANEELELLQAKSEALREQKKGLMQQLLTGKKRVKV